MSWAWPWAHRTIIGRRLKGLEDATGLPVVGPIRDEGGWAFTGGPYEDEVNGFELLADAYFRTDPHYDARFSVPVLWDKEAGRIVDNESGDILRMPDRELDPLATTDVRLCPPHLKAEIDGLNALLYDRVNDGVYEAGFATAQGVYEEMVRRLFETPDLLDERLAGRRFLLGPEPLEPDWRLFTTLVRFDAVYAVH